MRCKFLLIFFKEKLFYKKRFKKMLPCIDEFDGIVGVFHIDNG